MMFPLDDTPFIAAVLDANLLLMTSAIETRGSPRLRNLDADETFSRQHNSPIFV